uniref:JmjC domain-containing protein n=1 Tax=Panagrolaimus sp. ES5 TaxID=591445 RepID=A0AC34GR05_9BILA
MSEMAAAYSNRQPLGELNPTQMEILKILQINKDHLETNERSLLQHLEQRFRQSDKRHHGHQHLQAAETTVSNEVANSNLSKDLLEDPTMKPFPFLPANDFDNLMAQTLKDDPSTSNMGNYLEGNEGTIVAAENRQTPPIKSGELPSNFSLLSALHVPITITANEVLSKCQQRLSNPEAFSQIFDESCPPPRPDIIPLKQRPSMDKLGLKTPLIKVEKPSEAHSIELQNFCYKSPIALIRGLTTALKMDLSLFSTKSMTETQPDYSVEVRTQYRMPGDINVDQLGQPSWQCYSTRSYTNIGRYGVYQAESFRHSLKEETERLRAAGTGSKYAIAAAKAQAEGTPLGTIATTAPVASLLSLSSTATNTRESSSTPTPTSGSAPPPAKRRRMAGNQASVNASAAKLAAAANLCGPDDLPTGHMPMKVVKFGTNVDLSDDTKFPLQLKELNKMPAFTRNAAGACNLLSHLGHSVFGMNTVQMYMKVPGCRTPGHLENNCFASVNINIGPGECEWFGVDYEYWPVVNKMLNDRKMDLMKDSWWPNFEDLIKARVPVYRFTQKAGDLVWVGGGCVHWVQAIGWCNNGMFLIFILPNIKFTINLIHL